MAISGVSSGSSYRENWEANGGIYGTDETEESGSTSTSEQIWNAVFTDQKSSGLTSNDFLSLMVAQMTNQDFMNPMDDTQYVTQLAQFYSMQSMQELANYTKTSYVMGMVGKTVTAARITVSGELVKETGPVQKITLTNNEFAIYVNGKRFTLEQIMELGTTGETTSTDTDTPLTEDQIMQRKEYLNSLLGHAVSITVKEEDGTSYEVEGVVEKVSTKDGLFRVYVRGEWYSLDDVTDVFGKIGSSDEEEEEVPSVDEVDTDNKAEDTQTGGDLDPSDTVGGTGDDEKVDQTPETGGSEETEEPDDEDDDIPPAEEVTGNADDEA